MACRLLRNDLHSSNNVDRHRASVAEAAAGADDADALLNLADTIGNTIYMAHAQTA